MKLDYAPWFVSVLVAILVLAPVAAEAAGLSSRSDSMSTSQPAVLSTHVISFTTATGASIGSIGFDFCTTAGGACTVPTGLDTTGASLTAQSGATGFTLVSTTNGAPYVTRAAVSLPALTAVSYTLSNVTNPTAVNTSFYVRITTYTGSDGATGPIDTGNVAASTAQPIQLTGVTPELLIFCVGTGIAGNCSTATGNTINFGDFSPISTSDGVSQMQATTNAGAGYNITVTGTTLESGANSITALSSQTASAVGSAQFGLNLRANTTPTVGADPSTGSGAVGTYTANYGTPNQYRFVSGDTVAQASVPTNANTFTTSYVVNIPGLQAAGVYTTTMTYICTANF